MTRIETKSKRVALSRKQEIIQKYKDSGWTLQSSREFVDNYLSSCGGTIYQNSQRYVKLLFRRDRDIGKYKESASVESRFTCCFVSADTD
ncbi:MAG: hypothetical protein FWE84_00085 [Firmicutes bacterium]|nr:hypothetical protein [Bacillota bacterium]